LIKTGKTALLLAAQNGSKQTIKLLLAAGANIYEADNVSAKRPARCMQIETE
jgi:ankyrin repeat protein